MKKLLPLTFILMLFQGICAQTTTTSNAAVFDGDNVVGSDPIVEFGKASNGGTYKFSSKISGSGGEIHHAFYDANNLARNSYVAYDTANVITYSGINGGYFYQLFDLPNGTFMSLTNSKSQLVIGADVAWGASHKFIVNSGNSFFDGNVGIGTESFVDANDNLEYKLSVEGKVRAHEIKVYTTWADYVFEDDYDLPSLEEVEEHIKTKGHLKDIPSAKEVDENGIEVGEMNKLLLQKIEELTLYVIEQNKEMSIMKAQLEALESKKECVSESKR